MSIQIVIKKGNMSEVVEDANNRKEAKSQVDYWRRLIGKGWKVFSTVKK